MKLLILHLALLYVLVIANPINQTEEPIPQISEIGSEYGDNFEGDMILPLEEVDNMKSGRSGVKALRYRWPKSGGFVRVPYVFNTGYTIAEKNAIQAAMNEIQSKTCVRFVIKTTEADYVRITNAYGCTSCVGKIGGRQELILQSNACLKKGNVMHQLVHTLGYGHQHSHPQRDQRITILWNNIIPGRESNFNKLSATYYDNFGTPFDIDSIMHYDDYAYSKNGQLTIQAKNPADQYKMGQRTALSSGDIARIKNMYGC